MAEGRHRRLAGHGGEVHDLPPAPAISNLENLPGEPRRTDHGRRLHRRPNGDASPARRPRARTSTRDPHRRRRPADGAWTAQQLREAFPFGSAPCYLLRDSGSRVCRLVADREGDGHSRGGDGAQIAVAERLRGTLHRRRAPRVSRSRHRVFEDRACAAPCRPTPHTICARERISPWPKTRR